MRFWLQSSVFLGVLLVACPLAAQDALPKKPKKDVKLYYRSDYSGGFFLHSNGFGGNFRYAQYRSGSSKRIFGAEILNMRHPKQEKTFNPYFQDAKGYFYGKLNSLTMLRLNIGRQNVIYGKEVKKGVQVSYVYQVGPTIGFVKPIYLEIAENNNLVSPGQIRTERYDPEEHDLNNIFGRAPFTQGLAEMQIYPGLHAKLALNFEYSPQDENLKAIELGMTVDAFAQEVPIMAYVENNQFWLTFFVAIQFGKKIL